ncbi:MAG: hypothetical protein EBX37_11355 [Alphaproteobacteria bacterium]|nr:hypothetical protein [Alphaproteobacteria bacterium]
MSFFDVRFFLERRFESLHGIEKDLRQVSMSSVWMEYYILFQCRELLLQKKTIHVPLFLVASYCPSQFLLHLQIPQRYRNGGDFSSGEERAEDHRRPPSSLPPHSALALEDPYFLFLSERYDGNAKDWITSEVHSLQEWRSFFLQIMVGLLFLQYHVGMVHQDLHWSNILLQKIEFEEGDQWEYFIQDERICIPNHGCLFLLWDFGMASLYPAMIHAKEVIDLLLLQPPPNDKDDDFLPLCRDFQHLAHFPSWIPDSLRPYLHIPTEILHFCEHVRTVSYPNMLVLLISFLKRFPQEQVSDKHRILETFHLP